MDSGLTVEIAGAIAKITIDRPPVNAVDDLLLDALNRALDKIEKHHDVRVGVVGAATNSRGIFMAGADIRHLLEIGPSRASAFAHYFQQTCTRLALVSWPTIIALHGRVLGGGLEVALSCDVRVAAQGTQLGFPEAALGLIPGAGGTQRLTREVPAGVARDWMFCGEPIPIEVAYQYGLIQKILEPQKVMNYALQWANTVSARGPVAVRAIKTATTAALDASLSHGLAIERHLSDECWQTVDVQEGLAAFLEKRQPRFVGR